MAMVLFQMFFFFKFWILNIIIMIVHFFFFSDNSILWHTRLGHKGQVRITRLVREGLIGNLAKVTLSTCEHCLVGK